MARLLVIHHTPSPPTHSILHAVLDGANDPSLDDVEVIVKPALGVTVPDVLDAEGYLLGTPVNFGYMSGALKHAFDTFYYPVLDATRNRPYGLWVHGNDNTDGAIRSVTTIATGLGWVQAQPPLSFAGQPSQADLNAAWELGAATAAGLTL